MLISICSDLHLEYGYQELPGGEVLILAGDIAEVRSIRKHHHSTKILQNTPNEEFRCSEFFKYECAKYEKVFMVAGNHEHYHGSFHKTHEELKEYLPKNVSLMENDLIEYNGIMFIGATLWTDLNHADPITANRLREYLNDYKIVKNLYEGGVYHKLTPEYTYEIHKKTMKFFKETIEKNQDRKFVVITHHGPSVLSINEKYKHDVITNGGYVSDLNEFILDHENITHWVHGHMHDPVDYTIGSTRIISNPKGYVGRQDTSKFNPNFVFEI